MNKDILMDVLTTGLEGGIGYWASLDNTTPEWEAAVKFVSFNTNGNFVIEDVMWQLLENGSGVKFEDAEEEMNSEDWVLTMDKLLNGIEQWCEWKNIRSFERWYNKDGRYEFDAEDADVIYQFALFNEIVFA